MSVALGFHAVNDQVLLMADRQLTSADGSKHYEQKIFPMEDVGWCFLFAYTGFPELGKSLRDSMFSRINEYGTPSAGAIKVWLEECLTKLRREHRKEMILETLCVLSVQGTGVNLFRTAKNVATIGFKECIGVGDSSVLKYFAERFLRSDMTVDELLPWGIYMLRQAKDFVDGCGGDTDAAIISPNGTYDMLPNVNDIQNRTAMVEGEINKLLASFVDLSQSKEQFEIQLLEFCQAVRKLRPQP